MFRFWFLTLVGFYREVIDFGVRVGNIYMMSFMSL